MRTHLQKLLWSQVLKLFLSTALAGRESSMNAIHTKGASQAIDKIIAARANQNVRPDVLVNSIVGGVIGGANAFHIT